MEVIEQDGIPVIVNSFDAGTKTVRIKVKKRKIKKDAPLSSLPKKQKEALEIFRSFGCNPGLKAKAGELAGYSESYAPQVMRNLLKRKPIIEYLEKHSKFRFGCDVDEKVALVNLDALEANHPLAKGKKPDHLARLKAGQEISKIKGNYPAKKIEVDERVAIIHLDKGDIEAYKKYKELTNAD